MKFKIREIQAKTIMSKSGLPDVDWAINPYTGCQFGCKYCYATFVGKFTHKGEEWGGYVDAKVNAPALLLNELPKKKGNIFFSSVTDPYQSIEAKYQLTRKCLQVILNNEPKRHVSILTKSTLVLRDLDLFKQLPNLEVGITVTSTGDPISRYLETYASPNEDRLQTLHQLHASNIKTYAFVGPLLPHFVWQPDKLDKLFYHLKTAGVSRVYLEHLNLSPYISKRLMTYLNKDHPELIDDFQKARLPQYKARLNQLLYRLLKKYHLHLATSSTINHNAN